MTDRARPGRLLMVRHGQSRWNAKSLWTGIRDVGLTAQGHHEASLMGQTIADLEPDLAFVSQQLRAKETLADLLQAAGRPDIPCHVSAALNERDYGSYTGQNKWQVEAQIGQGAFEKLRRGWDFPVPDGETLKDVYNRSVPFFRETVLPQIQAGHTVLIVSHGNAIRSLVKYIEDISDEGIEQVEMIFGTVLVYELDTAGHMTDKQIIAIAADKQPKPKAAS